MRFVSAFILSWIFLTANCQAEYNAALAGELKEILVLDQKFRLQIDSVTKTFGQESDEFLALRKMIRLTDSLNQIRVLEILDSSGWLGKDVVGGEGNQALFLVIQHSRLEIQEKYLPMMRGAVVAGKAEASSLALLEDRTALRNGRRQIYGSQIGYEPEKKRYYVLPLDDPENVDERRALVGLPTMAEYVGMWGLKWNPKKYLKQRPYFESLEGW